MSDLYIVGFRPASLDEMRRLDRGVINRIVAKILFLARNVETVPHTALTGQLAGFYRLRVGDYRVIYRMEHDERLLIIEAVGHRRDVYET